MDGLPGARRRQRTLADFEIFRVARVRLEVGQAREQFFRFRFGQKRGGRDGFGRGPFAPFRPLTQTEAQAVLRLDRCGHLPAGLGGKGRVARGEERENDRECQRACERVLNFHAS